MRHLFASVASVICALAASPAFAQSNHTVYAGVQAGYAWSNADVSIPEYPSQFSMNADGATAGVFGGASWRVGHRISLGVEVDGNWANGRGRHLSGQPAIFEDAAPREQAAALAFPITNERYQVDQNWTADARLRVAYDLSERTQVYAAAGAAWSGLETRYIPNAGGTDKKTVHGWTVGVGVQHDYNEHLFTRAEVRYTNYQTGHFNHNGPSSVDLDSTTALVGIGYRFGHTAPPAPPMPPAPPAPQPAPPPAPCATSDFTVYFEWDRSNLNEAAGTTIDQAVAQARACNVSAVTVVGHTDTSGSTAYNVGLSQRRADVVRDALASRGIMASAITTQAVGETDLARQTRDGVREPLNRRTAVTISFQ